MSRFSGKCDLYDHISMEKMYPIYPNNPNSPLTNDDFECFEIFKKKTGGKIYQKFPLELTKNNIDYELEHSNPKLFCKNEDGTYTYYFTNYKDLKAINKYKYYATRIIEFDTILDLIPYYPYIIAISSCNNDTEYIEISSESYVDRSEKELRECGHNPRMTKIYRQALSDEYRRIVMLEAKKIVNKNENEGEMK